MIEVTSIKLYRAEGPTARCGPAGPFATWAQANGQLAQWAQSAPLPGNGYNKVDFEVTWADGESYSGRYDMNRWGEDSERDGHDLARHIRQFLVYIAHRPDCPGERDREQQYLGKDAESLRLKAVTRARYTSEAAEAQAFIAERLPGDDPFSYTRKSFSCCKVAA